MNESPEKGQSGCSEFEKCLKLLYLMLDNEASASDEEYLHAHINKCMFCFEQYEVEKQLRVLLKSKLEKLAIPAGLAENIKFKIAQSR
jgi:anti-sigma factor (TIGR02949 family)